MVSRVQSHHFFVDIAATPDELWELFWLRRALTQNGDVTIEILHPGDEIGEGLVRHCTFRVPRYLLSGGRAQSWEWLTEVTPKVSWKYNAVGKPLWSEAEGRTRLTFAPTLGSSVFPAIQNLLLAAHALGLGSTLTTLPVLGGPELSELLGLPDEVTPLAVVPLGHPATPLGPPRRRPLTEKAHLDRYGSPFPPSL
jgi:nitroreductase